MRHLDSVLAVRDRLTPTCTADPLGRTATPRQPLPAVLIPTRVRHATGWLAWTSTRADRLSSAKAQHMIAISGEQNRPTYAAVTRPTRSTRK